MRRLLARGVSLLLLALVLGALPLQAGTIAEQPQLLENRAYAPALLERIRGAKRRITCVFYLFKVGPSAGNLPRRVVEELVAAQRRGVKVTVILEGGKSVGRENMTAAGLLLQGGVAVVVRAGRSATHAKAVTIDDRYLLIGSHNLSQAALKHNNELSLLIDSPRLATETREYLERLR